MRKRDSIFLLLAAGVAMSAAMIALFSIPVALAFVVAAIAVSLVLLNPFHGLILYIFLLFARPQDFIAGLERFRIILAFAALIMISFFSHRIAKREPISIFATRRQILMFLFLLIIPASNIANFQLGAAWDGLVEFLTAFFLFFVIVNIVDDIKKFRTVCWTVVTCTVLVCINGLLQKFRGVDLIGQSPIEGRIRWIGLFEDPNDLALLINSFLPFVLVTLFEKNVGFLKRAGLALIAALFVLDIYYTDSRGGYLALMVLVAFFSFRRWGLLKGSAIGAVFLAAIFAFAPSRMANLSPGEASASGRIDAWTSGLVMLKSHPVLGIGFLRFTEVYERAAHSAYVSCLAELGLVGYFVWLSLVYSSLADLGAVGKSETSIPHKKYSEVLTLSFLGFLASAVFLSQAYSPILYMLCALATVMVRTAGIPLVRPRLLSSREILIVLMLIVASIVSFKAIAILFT